MRKTIDLVLVDDGEGVFFGLCDGSGPPQAITPTIPATTPHDVALAALAERIGRSLTDEAISAPPAAPPA